MAIRSYRDDDREVLERCIDALQTHVGTLDILGRERMGGNFDAHAYVERLLEKVRNHQGMIFVAEDEGKIAGCIAGIMPAQTQDDLLELLPSKDGEILELFVYPEYRGRQIGFGLMQAMEKYFMDHGCVSCRVHCFGPNVDTHEFYTKQGYTDRLITLLKILS